jgi:hypothetical protein
MLKGVYHIVIWLVKHFFDFFTPSLFQRGKLTSPPFGLWPGGPLAREGLWPGGKREAGRDFQSAKVLRLDIFFRKSPLPRLCQRGEFLPFVSDPERSLTRRVKEGRRDLVFSVYTIMD